MIVHNIVRFCIFSLLKYGKIFGKNLEHDTYGVKWSPWPSTLRGVCSRLGPWKLIVFQVALKWHNSFYDNICKTEAYFGGYDIRHL